MSELKDRLMAARKAKNMTQQQLAEAMNVTRATVSHWENGQRMPDVENVQRLQQILEAQLVDMDAAEAPHMDQEALPAERKRSSEIKKYLGQALSFVSGVAATLIVVLLFHMGGKTVAAPSAGNVLSYTELNAQPYSWYKQAAVGGENQANLEIKALQNPVQTVEQAEFSGGHGWFWTFEIRETNGVPFVVEEYTMTAYLDENTHGSFDMRQGNVDFFYGSNAIAGYETHHLNGGIPVQKVIGIAITLSGRDAYGNLLQFRGYVDLVQ